jgi:hypothetical protein
MIRILFFLFLSGITTAGFSQIKSSEELLDAMLKKHRGNWCRTFTFTQSTYRPNDSLNSRMVWYEAIEYPDKFRIDFNSVTKGNADIFRSDSAFRFRKGVLQDTKTDKNDLLLLLGGMYFRTREDVIKRLALLGYTLDNFSENTWRNRPVYVIGAVKGDSLSNQIWVDKEELRVVRTISHLSPKEVLEMRVQTSIPCCGGYLATKLSFYVNGKLDQQEVCSDIQTNVVIDPAVFEPGQFGRVHWKKTPATGANTGQKN